MKTTRVVSYGCSTSAGPSRADLWQGLVAGRDFSRSAKIGGIELKACLWPECQWEASDRERIRVHLQMGWHDALANVADSELNDVQSGSRTGVILASTKGCTNDFVWSESADLSQDPLIPILQDFLELSCLKPVEWTCVSNACASTVAGLYLAEQWFNQDRVDHVVILAADAVSPFVARGFSCLRALTPDRAEPFSASRLGFYLGEAAAVIILSRLAASGPRLVGVQIDSEGFAVTRPSEEGHSLRRCCARIGKANPDVVVAHGTGTPANDVTEDRVFSELYPRSLITSTKWSVGHTLGASAALDLIAGLEMLRHRRIFRMANTEKIDPAFKGRYVLQERDGSEMNQVLVSSLGFGGAHGVAVVSQ